MDIILPPQKSSKNFKILQLEIQKNHPISNANQNKNHNHTPKIKTKKRQIAKIEIDLRQISETNFDYSFKFQDMQQKNSQDIVITFGEINPKNDISKEELISKIFKSDFVNKFQLNVNKNGDKLFKQDMYMSKIDDWSKCKKSLRQNTMSQFENDDHLKSMQIFKNEYQKMMSEGNKKIKSNENHFLALSRHFFLSLI